MVRVDGMVYQVKCKVYSMIEGHDKLIVLKLYSLCKHASKRKVDITNLSVAITKEYYFSKTNQHVFN